MSPESSIQQPGRALAYAAERAMASAVPGARHIEFSGRLIFPTA